jgi:phosphatidylserine/phosphatidylglycerophosphate/cardiolipin synthase-like enzyme
MVLDGRVAFIGGMNFRPVHWDTDAHLVLEPRRMAIDASTRDRMDVAAEEEMPDYGPRKDDRARIEGPNVKDAEEIGDDVFLSVGSCNENDRSMVYEGELNVAVYDAAWVNEARRRVLSLILRKSRWW